MKIFRKTKIMSVIAGTFLILGIFTPATKSLLLKTKADTYIVNGIGFATNIVRQGVGEFDAGSPILSQSFLNGDEIEYNETELDTYDEYDRSGVSYSRLLSQMQEEYKERFGGGISYGAFSADAYGEFSESIKIAKNALISQLYTIRSSEKQIYSLDLKGTGNFSQKYEGRYDSDYLIGLKNLKEGNGNYTDYNKFFDTYGTHVITGGVYGGSFDAFYSVYSETEGFSANILSRMQMGIEAAYNQKNSFESSMVYDISGLTELNITNIRTTSGFHTKGGNTTYQNQLQSGLGYYTQWRNSVNRDTAKLIGYTYNGLQPLWETLPLEYSGLAERMKTYFEKYATENNNIQAGTLRDRDIIEGKDYVKGWSTIREEEKTITDSDRWHNPYDVADLTTLFGYKFRTQTLKTYGYNKVKIEVNFDAKRVDDAEARLVFIYQNENMSENESNVKLMEKSFSNINGQYQNYTFSTICPIEDLYQNKIVVRYRATGAWSDDWINKSVKIRLTFTE